MQIFQQSFQRLENDAKDDVSKVPAYARVMLPQENPFLWLRLSWLTSDANPAAKKSMNDLISAAMSKISFYEKLRENAIVTGKKPITLKKYVVDAMDKMLALMIQQHSFRISPPFEIPGICQKCHRELVLKGNDPTNWRFF